MAEPSPVKSPDTIRELVEVRPHPTVVRLEDLERQDGGWITDSYHLTGAVRDHLRSLEGLLARPSGQGLFLIGPYGSGKSHFLAYVARRLQSGRLLTLDEPVDAPSVRTISLVDFPARRSLEEIVHEAVGVDGEVRDRKAAWTGVDERHPEGLLLIVDELSEFLRSKEDHRRFNEDVRFLQFLGERASSRRLWVLAAMQEGIEHTGELEHDLYRKIKDRYPIRYLLSAAHVRDLVSESLLLKRPGYAEAVDGLLAEVRSALPRAPIDDEAFRAVYPLHPVTLELLEEVRDRFSQARGAVEFVVSRLRGDESRGIAPFLDSPWGALVGPDQIVGHFRDLFEVQPEFLPLAQKLLPWYRKHLAELFPKPVGRQLAARLIDLLILVHLAPAREALSAEEAAYWLLWRAARIDPERNLAVVRRALETLADSGRWVTRRGAGFALDLDDDGDAALERRLEREKASLRDWGDGLFELVAPLLRSDEFNPVALPRDRWQPRVVRWHFHERHFAVWLGSGAPEPREGLTLCLRLPWGDGGPAEGHHTLQPRLLEVGEDTLELAALARLRESTPDGEPRRRLERRLAERLDLFRARLRSAYDDLTVTSPVGATESVPRVDPSTPIGTWLERHAQAILRRRYPAFEERAPLAGPLVDEAYRKIGRAARAGSFLDDDVDDLVRLAREAYLVPLGLLRQQGRKASFVARPERHELVREVLALVDGRPSPRAIAERLARPPYGLVADQTRLLLILLLILGEIDILRGEASWQSGFEERPDPLEWERVVVGVSLDLEAQRDLEVIAEALKVRLPREWTVTAARRAIGELRKRGDDERRKLGGILERVERGGEGGTLGRRLREVIDKWSVLSAQEDELAAFREFRRAIGLPSRFLSALAALSDVPERLARIGGEVERLSRVLAQPVVRRTSGDELRGRLGELGEPPSLGDLDRAESWARDAAEVYGTYRDAYASAHDEYWRAAERRAVVSIPAGARSERLGLGAELARLDECLRRVRRARCEGLASLEQQPMCPCGFDGSASPVEEDLRTVESLTREVASQWQAFLARADVRARLRESAEAGAEGSEAVRAWLEGRAELPRFERPEELEHLLAGVDDLVEVPLERVREALVGREWTRREAGEAFERLLDGLGSPRLRFVDAGDARAPDGRS